VLRGDGRSLSAALRVARASLDEIAGAQFLDDLDASDRAGDVTDAIVSAVARKNQFVAYDPRFEAGVAREVTALLDALASGTPREDAIARARVALAGVMRVALGEHPREVACATYSPELQLAILSLEIESMREPILDVGSGADAALVRFLRDKKKDARGVDRECPMDLVEAGVATRADWLTYDYGAERYGTITSHLGFTLHFVHQEMKRSDLAFDYARAYMRIVKALAPGGTFAYVPGVPFIEAMLPRAQIEVVTVPLANALVTESVRRVQEATGLILDAATHVRKVARP